MLFGFIWNRKSCENFCEKNSGLVLNHLKEYALKLNGSLCLYFKLLKDLFKNKRFNIIFKQ